MAKPDQTLRVILEKAGDERALLVAWRKGLDFYSAIAGSVGHRSYHERGRVHTNVGKWGAKDYYVDKKNEKPSNRIDGTHILQGMILRNDDGFHFGQNPLKKYSGKRADILLNLNQKNIGADSFLVVLSGMTTDPTGTEKDFFDLTDYESLELVKLEILINENAPSIFVAAIEGKSCFDKRTISKDLEKLLTLDSIVILDPPHYTSIDGESISVTLRFPELGLRSPPASSEPPYLPIKIEDWMQVHEVELRFHPLKGTTKMVGPLTIKALPSTNILLGIRI